MLALSNGMCTMWTVFVLSTEWRALQFGYLCLSEKVGLRCGKGLRSRKVASGWFPSVSHGEDPL